jgi:hypothetical protein
LLPRFLISEVLGETERGNSREICGNLMGQADLPRCRPAIKCRLPAASRGICLHRVSTRAKQDIADMKISARNQLKGTITEITKGATTSTFMI